MDKDGYFVAEYVYDAWGKILLMKDKNGSDISNNTSHIGYINPIRYRSYYVETNLYYLESRYYDPETGRFLNADSLSYLGEGSDLQNYNLYSYCENNPVMYSDPSGHSVALAVALGAVAVLGLGLTIGGVATDNNGLTATGLGLIGMAAIISGGTALFGAIKTGAMLTGAVGSVTALVGAGSLAFMLAEIQEATGNGNWILDSGMSEGCYNGLMIGTAAIATVGTLASGFLHVKTLHNQITIGTKFNPVGSTQIGVDLNTLTISRPLHPQKIKAVKAMLEENGMYGVVKVTRNGFIIDGNHRVAVARMLKIAVDVIIK